MKEKDLFYVNVFEEICSPRFWWLLFLRLYWQRLWVRGLVCNIQKDLIMWWWMGFLIKVWACYVLLNVNIIIIWKKITLCSNSQTVISVIFDSFYKKIKKYTQFNFERMPLEFSNALKLTTKIINNTSVQSTVCRTVPNHWLYGWYRGESNLFFFNPGINLFYLPLCKMVLQNSVLVMCSLKHAQFIASSNYVN